MSPEGTESESESPGDTCRQVNPTANHPEIPLIDDNDNLSEEDIDGAKEEDKPSAWSNQETDKI